MKGCACLLGLLPLAVHGIEINYGNKGADGEFQPTGAVHEVDLALATSAPWDSATPANDHGVYDGTQWAVVFKFRSVQIPAGTTVRFKNHPSHAPVVWLVDGDVTIDGTLVLDGQDGLRTDAFTEPGPGGFRGGIGVIRSRTTSGFGPGGGDSGNWGGGGAFGTVATGSQVTYGNADLIPLVGGSGGGGYANGDIRGGGAGGGAILIATPGTLRVGGKIQANGGGVDDGAGSGSGGGVRLVAGVLAGNGFVACRPGSRGSRGGEGRVRVEAATQEGNLNILPAASFELLEPTSEARLWPDSETPLTRIVSVGNRNVPADPRGNVQSLANADVRLPAGSRTNVVVIETLNLPTNSVVTLHVVARDGGPREQVPASYVGTDPTRPTRHLWEGTVVLNPAHHAFQVVAKAP
jgi:plastocyanin